MPKINRSTTMPTSVPSEPQAPSRPQAPRAATPATPAAVSTFQPHVAAAARVEPARTGPVTMRVPISCSAGYPFSPENYGISVNSVYGQSQFAGRVKEIYYGFTPKTKSDYLAHNDVPWFNKKGEAVAEGVLKVGYHHDGGYKGTYVMDELPQIEVPEGMNLVFKLRIEKFGGDPLVTGDTQHHGEAETMTYFVDRQHPLR